MTYHLWRLLRAVLQTLTLTGMLDTLDARLAQNRDGGLGHLEFLGVPAENRADLGLDSFVCAVAMLAEAAAS